MVQAWYSEPIEKIRFTADSGGESLTIEEAEQRVEELQEAIQEAKND